MVSRSASPETVTSSVRRCRSVGDRQAPGGQGRGEGGDAAGADVDGHRARLVQERRGGGVGDQAAGVEHDHVVADLGHVVEEVGGQHHRDAEAAQAVDQGQHLLPAGRVEAGGGLVEQDELGVGDDGLGQLGPLAHAGGEAAHRPEAGLVQPDQVEHLRRPLAGGPHRQPAELAEGGHHVGRGLVEGQAVVLGHVADAAADADGVVGHGDAADLDRPRVGPAEAEEEAEEGGLARPVGPDQADPPGGQVEVDVVEGGDPGVPLRQPPGPDDARHLAPTLPAVRGPVRTARRAPSGHRGCCIPYWM